ncbi:Enoyl-[acyl-carrier-protein] reductase [NADH] [Dyadobacter koreensis]|uniref:Enoyl-[acyl-carrier-protein] reductase [NADH] n=1 Tax=Dyadobacter koreensis TaxID=408657 RepID=A0A1H6QIA4_9BACT|nr:SDR family oxidoreductase [Dyadobacter koreensis]SEI43489.1 Enoyl-[acyl-carrier-protein] reductase [NADH] [Dyadobacter koreensis]
MLLENKNALIYGAGGSLGAAVAKAFAKEGATVFLSGHHLASVLKIRDEIISEGGRAEAEEVDALDESAVNGYVESVFQSAGSIDISFNLIGLQDSQDVPIVEMKLDDFVRPIIIAMKTHFITSASAGRFMVRQKSGVILFLTATPAGMSYANVGGFGPACSAMEGFSRNLAAELGPAGVRVVCIRSAGSPDSAVFANAIAKGGIEIESAMKRLLNDTMLNRLPKVSEIAETAVFLASDRATAITGTALNVTCGTTMD